MNRLLLFLILAGCVASVEPVCAQDAKITFYYQGIKAGRDVPRSILTKINNAIRPRLASVGTIDSGEARPPKPDECAYAVAGRADMAYTRLEKSTRVTLTLIVDAIDTRNGQRKVFTSTDSDNNSQREVAQNATVQPVLAEFWEQFQAYLSDTCGVFALLQINRRRHSSVWAHSSIRHQKGMFFRVIKTGFRSVEETVGLVQVVSVGPEEFRAKILRGFYAVEPGQQLREDLKFRHGDLRLAAKFGTLPVRVEANTDITDNDPSTVNYIFLGLRYERLDWGFAITPLGMSFITGSDLSSIAFEANAEYRITVVPDFFKLYVHAGGGIGSVTQDLAASNQLLEEQGIDASKTDAPGVGFLRGMAGLQLIRIGNFQPFVEVGYAHYSKANTWKIGPEDNRERIDVDLVPYRSVELGGLSFSVGVTLGRNPFGFIN